MPRSWRLVNGLTALALLAVFLWAEGGVHAVAAQPALVAFVVVSLALFVAAGLSAGNLDSGVREDRSNRWGARRLRRAELDRNGGLPRLRSRQHRHLRRRRRPLAWGRALRHGRGVASCAGFRARRALQRPGGDPEGPRTRHRRPLWRIRNPSYLGLVVNAVGFALVFRSAPGVVVALLNLVPLHARMDAEERLLEETFGDEYRGYRTRTARLVPGVY